jgi:FkbM family methyltransferase
LKKFACRHLGLYPDPPLRINELAHPIGLITDLGYQCRGVIHVGANTGWEFDSYRRAELASVIYIEAIPEIFARLQARISVDKRHRAINALCTDRDGDMVDFHIASNAGRASSIFELGTHAERHPKVKYVGTLKLQTTTLDRLIFETPTIDPQLLDCLVLDVQGAEAKVLAGGKRTLGICRFVFAEVNQGGLYKGDVAFVEIIDILKR